jgi:hypothetical protein
MTSTNSPSATCNVVAAACPASNSSTLAAFVTSSKSPRHDAPVVAGPLQWVQPTASHGPRPQLLDVRADKRRSILDITCRRDDPSHHGVRSWGAGWRARWPRLRSCFLPSSPRGNHEDCNAVGRGPERAQRRLDSRPMLPQERSDCCVGLLVHSEIQRAPSK